MLICSHPSQVSIAELITTDLTRLTWKVCDLSLSLFPSCHCSMLICSHPSQVSIAELIATDLTRLTWKKVYDLSLSLLSLSRSLATRTGSGWLPPAAY